ncbi:MAG: glycosyltransferase, partial [Muribaculaceae bacterium]|nr:glycosyltransferase [Muribaculaceae bacterium]
MKVSVIIPIYNTGEYLRGCIESICRQTYRDLEIIMIDDGSAVETASICDEIASTDSRIIVRHKKNEGVSKARNVGLEPATGEIICFGDSDDTIAPEMITDLVSAMVSDG